mgnify:FL=1
MKQVRRSVKQILFSLTLVMVFFINIHPVMAQEISNESKNAIWNEFEEKRENGLEVLEEVCPLSARMVVNQVSMKMENERISKLIEDLRKVI